MKKDWKLIKKILQEIIEIEPNFQLGSTCPERLIKKLKEDDYIHVAFHTKYSPMTFVLTCEDLLQMHFLHHNFLNIENELSENTIDIPVRRNVKNEYC